MNASVPKGSQMHRSGLNEISFGGSCALKLDPSNFTHPVVSAPPFRASVALPLVSILITHTQNSVSSRLLFFRLADGAFRTISYLPPCLIRSPAFKVLGVDCPVSLISNRYGNSKLPKAMGDESFNQPRIFASLSASILRSEAKA